jgi:hypothetical protein
MRLPENQTRLRFSVDRGPLIATKAIRFIGNDTSLKRRVREKSKGLFGREWERYDRRRYDYFTQKCSRELLFSKGFFRARIIETKSEIRDGVRNVVVVLTEGPRYRLGKITIDGNQVFSDREILEFFGQKSGDIANGQDLKDFAFERFEAKVRRTWICPLQRRFRAGSISNRRAEDPMESSIYCSLLTRGVHSRCDELRSMALNLKKVRGYSPTSP